MKYYPANEQNFKANFKFNKTMGEYYHWMIVESREKMDAWNSKVQRRNKKAK